MDRTQVIRDAAKRGAKLFDDRKPGWEFLVDPDKIDMRVGTTTSGACGCVAAQIEASESGKAGFYGDITKELFPITFRKRCEEEAKHGFILPEDIEPTDAMWDYLGMCWKLEIMSRRFKDQGKIL